MAAFTTVNDPGLFFDTSIWTGDGSTTHAITGVGFQPDLTWIKQRDATENNVMTDSVRGVTESLYTNTTGAEATTAESLKTFGTDGFTLGDDALVNTDTGLYAGWSWKAGTTSGIDTTGSTITPDSYSFNQDAGFSIVKYAGNSTAGALVPHGLGAVPHAIFVKSLGGTQGWMTYHQRMDATAPEDYYVKLNATAGRAASAAGWNDTAPTSVNIVLGADAAVNTVYDYVAYSWTEKQGYSKFGIYTGNGNADGTSVYTGFKPRKIIIKDRDNTNNWRQFDIDRNDNTATPYGNVIDGILYPSSTGVETGTTNVGIDFLANGFKLRGTVSAWNGSGRDYIYWCWGESPFVNAEGAPGNAF